MDDALRHNLRAFFDEVEWVFYEKSGMNEVPGGYATATLEFIGGGTIYFNVEYGSTNYAGKSSNTLHFEIPLDVMMSDVTIDEKMNSTESVIKPIDKGEYYES
jgi:hypothetical protein